MGTQFFWFYDILLIAVFAGLIFAGTRQGFIKGISKFIGFVLAFLIALVASGPVSSVIYERFIEPSIVSKITYTQNSDDNDGTAKEAFETLRKVDMSKATIDGEIISVLVQGIEPDSYGTVTLDLANVSLADTGIVDGNLAFFGLDAKYDFEKVNIGKVDISAADYEKYKIEDIILSRTVSHKILERARTSYNLLNENLAAAIPGISKATSGSENLVALMLVNVIDQNNDSVTLESAINTHLVRPVLISTIKIFIFTVIFALISIIVSIIIKSLDVVNYVPLVGGINSLLGSLLGAVKALIVILIICIGVRAAITLTDNNVIFLNSMTIDKTFVFRHLYYLKILA